MSAIPSRQMEQALARLRTAPIAGGGCCRRVRFGRSWELLNDLMGHYTLIHYGCTIFSIAKDGSRWWIHSGYADGGYSQSDCNGINSLSMLVCGRKMCRRIGHGERGMLVDAEADE